MDAKEFVKVRKEMYNKSGIRLISEERNEHKTKHQWTNAHDDKYENEELMNAAIYILTGDLCYTPEGWDGFWLNKIENKPYKDRLIIAGSLLAAEIDRLIRQGK